ncbi:RNA polymerase-binding protein DksA [Buchnera aphidicola]|uniref:RNA polymerase-binding transcription factor DksA n=1 Tax=Buchnera aphidicola subsp. Uroleucon sonchi TaxID=118118 RepID=A0A6C1F609_BUCUN|nr:RNA polymerase-binding protein DksA [Buchnera aphidicola]QIE01933.1 RNA polymerase-binding protein DksA [Buchnera aphidicola (Uroleucon sonchi)]
MKKKKNKKQTSSLNVLAIAGLKPYQKKNNEQYMNEDQMLHFDKILQTWKNQLQKEIDHTLFYMQDKATNFPDPIDRATQEEEFSLDLRNRDRSRKLIKKIEKTLKKIQEKNFGYCDSCGIEIGIRRLEARPTANLCIDCKTLAEIREKQMTG